MVTARSRLILLPFVAAFLVERSFALQLSAAPPRDVDSKELQFAQQADDASGSSGFVQAVVSRLQEDFQGLKSLLPKPASSALGLIQEEQEPGHLNPSYREQQKQEQARRDAYYGIVMQGIFMALFALVYKQYKVRPEVDASFAAAEKEKLNVEWESGYFACFNDMSICCVGCFCPLILWADNMDLVHVLAFWTAVAIAIGIYVANVFIPLAGFAMIGIMVWGRSKIRQKFNMKFNTMGVLAEDLVCLFCCMPCVTCLDARHLQAAGKAGHEAVAPEEKEEANAA